MNQKIKDAIEKIKEVKNILNDFSSKDEAIEYLVKETKLSKEECSAACDFISAGNESSAVLETNLRLV